MSFQAKITAAFQAVGADIKALQAGTTNAQESNFKGTEVPVIFILGQSNADGWGNTNDVPGVQNANFTDGSVKIWKKEINTTGAVDNHVNDGYWKNYEIADQVSSQKYAANSFGPELNIALRWQQNDFPKHSKPLHIIKCTVGESPIADVTGVDNDWDNDIEDLRQLALEYFALPALNKLLLDGLKPKCLGIFWGQGETDSYDTTNANNYLNALTDLFVDLRAKTGFLGAKAIIMQLSNWGDNGQPDFDADWGAVKQAQNDFVVNDDNAVLIKTDGAGGEIAIDRYLNNKHYSSIGQLALGSLIYDHLDFFGNDFEHPWDFVFIGSAAADGAPINKGDIDVIDRYGVPAFVSFPTNAGNVNAISWVRGGNTAARPTVSTRPIPMFRLKSMDNHTDFECIFRLLHDGDSQTSPSLIFHSDEFSETDNHWLQYLVQITNGGGQLKFFENTGNGWHSNRPVATPTQQPKVGEPYWYRVTQIGSLITFYNSPDGGVWTSQLTTTRGSIASGAMWFSLFNGKCDKSIGALKTAHCAFDVIMARKL